MTNPVSALSDAFVRSRKTVVVFICILYWWSISQVKSRTQYKAHTFVGKLIMLSERKQPYSKNQVSVALSIVSINFAAHDLRKTGRKDAGAWCGFPDLLIGTTHATLHACGMLPVRHISLSLQSKSLSAVSRRFCKPCPDIPSRTEAPRLLRHLSAALRSEAVIGSSRMKVGGEGNG